MGRPFKAARPPSRQVGSNFCPFISINGERSSKPKKKKKRFKSNLNCVFVSGGVAATVKIDQRTRGAEFRKVKVQPRRHSCETQKGTEGNEQTTK